MRFFVKCNPPTSTHHHKKIVRCGKFHSLADKPELVEAKESLASLFMPHAPETPFEGPLCVTLSFEFGWNKSHTKKQRSHGSFPKSTKPDCSNLAKTLEDVMTRLGFWNDDAQIVSLYVEKMHSDMPGIGVSIEPVGKPQ